jgi:hypothetical protein
MPIWVLCLIPGSGPGIAQNTSEVDLTPFLTDIYITLMI